MLLVRASMLHEVDEALAGALTPDVIAGIVELIPDEWLTSDEPGWRRRRCARPTAGISSDRLAPPRPFVEEAVRAR